MKRISTLLLVLLVAVSAHAQYSTINRATPKPAAATTLPPLKIGIGRFSPPFEIEYSPTVRYGFDVTLAEFLCKSLSRPCQFVPMSFSQLLMAVESNQVDMAIGAITITAERSERVNFTTAYLPSQSRFIGPTQLASQVFSLDLLSNKKIGIESGTVFPKQIQEMGIKNPILIPFETEESLVEALSAGEVDIALMDSPTAEYWQNHSGDALKLIGPHFPYGFGYGIAVNKFNLTLLHALNQRITEFLNSNQFKQAYKMYFEDFL
jgi:polar amino acid transport system substrate-binding protein